MAMIAAEAAGGTAAAGSTAAGSTAAGSTAAGTAARTAGAAEGGSTAGGSKAAQSTGQASTGGQKTARTAQTVSKTGERQGRTAGKTGGPSRSARVRSWAFKRDSLSGLKLEFMLAFLILILWPVSDKGVVSNKTRFSNWVRQILALTLMYALLLGIAKTGRRTNGFATLFGLLVLLGLALSRQGRGGTMIATQVMNGIVGVLTPVARATGGRGISPGAVSRTGAGASAPPEEGSATSAGGGGGGNSGASAASASRVQQQRAPRRNATAAPRSRPGAPGIAGLQRNPATGRAQTATDILPPLGGEPIRGGRPTLRLPTIRPNRTPQVAPDAPGILGVPFRMQRGSVVPQLPSAPKRRTTRGTRTRGEVAI